MGSKQPRETRRRAGGRRVRAAAWLCRAAALLALACNAVLGIPEPTFEADADASVQADARLKPEGTDSGAHPVAIAENPTIGEDDPLAGAQELPEETQAVGVAAEVGGQPSDAGFEACDVEGELECSSSGAAIRQCTSGTWQLSVCGPGELCTTSATQSPSCRQPLQCTQTEPVQCDGGTLQQCREGRWFLTDCGAPELCNARVGRCNACPPGEVACLGAALTVCSADGAVRDVVERCAEGELCDARGGQCDVCVPGEASCSGQNVVRCAPDGQDFLEETQCAGLTPLCREGRCAGCVGDADCAPPTPYCSSLGLCETCLDDSQCASPNPHCEDGSCIQCRQDADCPSQAECFAGTCID